MDDGKGGGGRKKPPRNYENPFSASEPGTKKRVEREEERFSRLREYAHGRGREMNAGERDLSRSGDRSN